MTNRALHNPAMTLGLAFCWVSGKDDLLGFPIEKTTDPPTGCPSAEITRQLKTCVPSPRPCGGTSTSELPKRSYLEIVSASPDGLMTLSTKGCTVSLNVSVNVRGA